MKYIINKTINQKISKEYDLEFSLGKDALCLIEITASAKSWWQNFKFSRSFFKDDDIFLFLDNKEITTSKNTKQDSRALWNGNELCNLEKTVLIAINLSKGRHIIKLKADQSPYLKSISVSGVEENNKIIYFPNSNNPAPKKCVEVVGLLILPEITSSAIL